MRFFEHLKSFLGVEKHSEHVENYFSSSNVKSGFWVSLIVSVLEILMILNVLIVHFLGSVKRTLPWLVAHLTSYAILLSSSIFMLIVTSLSIRGKIHSRALRKTAKFLFSVVAIAFGIYISFLDYAKGEQFITLLTMTLFTFCFIVWRPIFSISFLLISYTLFFHICNLAYPASYATKINLTIALIAILTSAINAYHQKMDTAIKDEKLNRANDILVKLSISDEVTGIANMNYFRSQAVSIMQQKDIDVTRYIFLFLDIEHFKGYNEKYGFWEGNNFLRDFAELLDKTFPNSVTAHFSNDNFAIFTEDIDIQKKLTVLRDYVKSPEFQIRMGLKVGAFRPEDRDILPILACDHARYACYSIKKHYGKDYCEYDKKMAVDFYRKQYIINNLDHAIENDYIKVYYQPLIDAKTGTLCGLEALARWDDPEFGFLAPAAFVQTLEEYHQIHKLDMRIMEKVCADIKQNIESNNIIIPVSLNFSRLDFDMLDLAQEVENTLNRYGVEKKYIHVEITESALTENDIKLKEAMKKFRSSGYALWLDDFGSGYSGLNVLKEYDFDMMKIDMKFLTNFAGNKKARSILKNVVTLANDLGMKTLTEGVETDEAYEFLQSIGCEKMQGFLFGKPMPKEELEKKIKDGSYKLDKNILKKL